MTAADDPGPLTRATTAAEQAGLRHEVRVIERARSAEDAAHKLGVAADRLLKSLVVRRAANDYLFVLVPGPDRIDWPSLRAHLGVSRLSLPDAEEARQITGYERGTITPLGSATALPVVAPASLVGAGEVAVGAGAHGVFVVADADDLLGHLDAGLAEVTGP